jgi:DNA end-binding protein Ku
MVRIAAHILDSKAGHFDPSRFKDLYEAARQALVRREAKGKPIEPPEQRAPDNVINLMDALRQSVAGRKRDRGAKSARAKRRTRRMRRAA